MPSSLYQELNRSVHSMQSRVADLIERVQDEIILESTLQINDELNSVFVRYERSEYTGTRSEPASTHDCVSCVCVCRYLRNREALQQPVQGGVAVTTEPQSHTHTEGGMATTSLNEVSAGFRVHYI